MRQGDVIAQRFRLDRLLGSGGMGSVWAASHVVTSKPVALKFLRTQGDDDTARRRVLREARAACAVQHPSVVAVHDIVETDDGLPVLVMDLLRGESLRSKLERERTLGLDETLRIAEVVLGALEVAHEAGIVHRDLKPDNLFLLETGEIKLLDFGVAKLVGSDGVAQGSGTLTATGAMVGTPYYMAPEQAFGEAIDGRADLWAAGIVMFECLAGEPPTRGDNLGQVLRLLSTGKIDPLAKRAPHVPPSIAKVVDGLLRIEADERLPTARAVLDALAEARAHQGDAVSDPSKEAQIQTPIPSVAPPALLYANAPVQTGDGSEHSITPPPAPRFRRGTALIAAALIALGAAIFVRPPWRAPESPPKASRAQPTSEATPPASGTLAAEAPAADIPSVPSATSTPAPPATSASASHPPRPPVSAAAPTARPSSKPHASSAPPTKLLTDVPF